MLWHIHGQLPMTCNSCHPWGGTRARWRPWRSWKSLSLSCLRKQIVHRRVWRTKTGGSLAPLLGSIHTSWSWPWFDCALKKMHRYVISKCKICYDSLMERADFSQLEPSLSFRLLLEPGLSFYKKLLCSFLSFELCSAYIFQAFFIKISTFRTHKSTNEWRLFLKKLPIFYKKVNETQNAEKFQNKSLVNLNN